MNTSNNYIFRYNWTQLETIFERFATNKEKIILKKIFNNILRKINKSETPIKKNKNTFGMRNQIKMIDRMEKKK